MMKKVAQGIDQKTDFFESFPHHRWAPQCLSYKASANSVLCPREAGRGAAATEKAVDMFALLAHWLSPIAPPATLAVVFDKPKQIKHRVSQATPIKVLLFTGSQGPSEDTKFKVIPCSGW